MRVLYESLVVDPTEIGTLKGPAHVIYRSLKSAGVDLHVLGPSGDRPALWERILQRFYRRTTGRPYLRFPLSQASRFARRLEAEIERVRPDAVVTMFPSAISACAGGAPILYRLDATYRSLAREYPEYGYSSRMAELAVRMQRRACERSRVVVTHSSWCRESLVNDYGVRDPHIKIIGCPGGLRPQVIPDEYAPKVIRPDRRIRMLTIGFDSYRKGFDVAKQALEILVERGVDVDLTLCGSGEGDNGRIFCVGPFDKSRVDEEQKYVEMYRESDLLLAPTRWEPWGMVVSEAAAFGVPAVIREVAGTSSAVIDGSTGMLVPREGTAREFADAVQQLIADPERYQRLSTGARERYEKELSWDAFARHLIGAVSHAIEQERKG